MTGFYLIASAEPVVAAELEQDTSNNNENEAIKELEHEKPSDKDTTAVVKQKPTAKLTPEPTKEIEKKKPAPEPIDPIQQEKDMNRLINNFRTSKGLSSLDLDSRLKDISKIKSKELVERDYFSHTSPVYGSPKEMLDKFNVDYEFMGENLACNWNAAATFEAFRTSKQHRAILLNSDFSHIGVGVYVNDNNMIMVTVLVIDKP
jgi:uncharacterized protein YkwD